VYDGHGAPIVDCMLEIWQADSQGRFSDPQDKCALPNSSFKRFGRVGTDAKGGYAFDTIKPGVVPDPNGKPQAPHIVLAVFARGMLLHLYTWYFEDEAANANVAKPARSAPLPEQVAIANPDRPDQVTSYDFDVTARCEKLCDQTPPAAVMVNDQVIAGRDVAGDCIDHVVDELGRKPMLAQGGTSGRARYIGANAIPPARGVSPQDCLALAVPAHRAALRNAGRRSTGLSLSAFAAGGAAAAGIAGCLVACSAVTAAGVAGCFAFRSELLAAAAADASARFRSATAAARLASRAARISASLAAACSSSLALTSPTGLPSRSTRAAPATMPFRYIARRA